jgi:glucose/arabinose dehydrogenase/PKD repeat protein
MFQQLARAARALALTLLLMYAVAALPLLAATPPTGFADALVTNVASPTALAFTPDRRLLITQQTGQLRVYENGALLSSNALDLNIGNLICSDFERGLLGVAVDPSFAANHSIYVYYTFNKHNAPDRNSCAHNNSSTEPVNRVSRFTLSDSNVASGETVIVDNIPSPNGNHNAGDLHFGKDGYLYISVGEGGVNQNARRLDLLSGKILRVDRDGVPPATNPQASAAGARRCGDPSGVPAGTGPCSEMFAWGLRNPFRFAFDPNAAGTRFFINDVGQNTWEEIDEGQIGADYGWNVREGHCANGSTSNCGAPPAGMTNPIYDYGRGTGCSAITGGAFVPNGIWPATYDGAYLFADYGCGKIFRLVPGSGNSYTAVDFATNGAAPTAMIFGPYSGSQSLYYASFGGGQIRRIDYTAGANRPPNPVISANPTSGPAPLTVSFSSAGSSDPDGDPLTYDWNFGDGSPHATTATAGHSYASGTYTATLTLSDGKGGTGKATQRIDSGNSAPVPVISAPSATLRYRVGQAITLQGSASDLDDGPLPGSSLSWRVIIHHNTHTHPFLPPTTGISVTINAPGPEDLAATQTSYLEVFLSATDSKGLTSVVTRELRPNLVNITFATVPAGRRLLVNNGTITATQTLVSWESYTLNVSGPLQKNSAGQWLWLASWSDGGPIPTRAIVTPAAAKTYTATFAPARQWLMPLIQR